MSSARTDILLAMCPPYGPEMPPLSLASLVESARANGFTASVLDLNIDVFRAAPDPGEWEMDHKEQWVWPTKFPDLWKRHQAALEAGIAKLAESDARVYGFSCHSDNRLTTSEVIRALRRSRPDAIVIVGGMGVYSDTSRRSFQSGLVDAFVIGPEGEATLVEFLRAVRDGRSFDEVPGLVLWRDGALRETAARDVANLAEFPFPTFADFALAAYTTPNLPIVTSRGCKSHCLFCNDRVLMGKFRGRTAESVFDEIRHHVEVLGVRDFSFNDLQLNYNVTEIDRLCTLVNEHFGPASGAIRWNANIIVSDAFLPSILQNMRAAGCHTLTLGLETGALAGVVAEHGHGAGHLAHLVGEAGEGDVAVRIVAGQAGHDGRKRRDGTRQNARQGKSGQCHQRDERDGHEHDLLLEGGSQLKDRRLL
ncbi:MAG: cobalamin-dependent protein, partial [Deltaproteobacteria bacterium]|nr:cobalamin-dependent protein [Deltaproteobacteria bacterium]